MRYLGASAAMLVAAMTFSLTAHGETRTAIAVIPGPTVGVAPAGAPPCTATFCKSIPRYMNTGLLGITEYNTTPPCMFLDAGKWIPGTNIKPTDTDKAMTPAGTVDVSEPTFKGPTPPGCTAAGGPYFYKPIYFKWTLEKNLTAISGFGPTATFNSEWDSTAGTGRKLPYSFQITVPVVRPDHETTAFNSWSPVQPTFGRWHQTLIPTSDPTFDFTGETVQEFPPSGSPTTCDKKHAAMCPDKCWFPGSTRAPFIMITGGTWIIGQVYAGGSSGCEGTPASAAKNTWGYDCVGQGSSNVTYYRAQSPTLKKTGSCGTTFGQVMGINAPSDSTGSYTPYGNTNTGDVNTLGASETLTTVTSTRAGMTTPPHKWP